MSWVCILMGSQNDWTVMRRAKEVLSSLGVHAEAHVASAHRTPERVRGIIKDAEARDVAAFICGAGMAAHLAGAVAAHTLRPVIGVPIASGALSGFDAALSTVQMPPGIPVATVAVDGGRNAGFLAAQIIALHNEAVREALKNDREAGQRKVETATLED
ncbi:MAG: 5-(carboxyamino)imidazole ribonucleotide mutase [Gammaproteobacteria bacterium]|nr:5-(carboxyamino)imidazole ribonucleotide mutase [Gammaproteobacteria bacterium]